MYEKLENKGEELRQTSGGEGRDRDRERERESGRESKRGTRI
jgi:hypothetical protein